MSIPPSFAAFSGVNCARLLPSLRARRRLPFERWASSSCTACSISWLRSDDSSACSFFSFDGWNTLISLSSSGRIAIPPNLFGAFFEHRLVVAERLEIGGGRSKIADADGAFVIHSAEVRAAYCEELVSPCVVEHIVLLLFAA